MKRVTKWIPGIIIFICIIAGILLFYSPVPEKSSFNVTIEELRLLAGSNTTEFPVSINAVNIADFEFPPGIVVAGYFSPIPVSCYTWQINYEKANGQNIIVDTAQNKSQLKEMSANGIFHKKEYNQMQNALRSASKIVFTHEHADHTGGAAVSPYFDDILPKLYITPEQKSGEFMARVHFPEGALDKMQKLVYDRVMKFAPGVVLIKTPGHTQGSQALFVKLSNGKEYIIAGDIAWSMLNINIPRGRPLLTTMLLKENRSNTANQLRWLNDMQKNGLTILLTHDRNQVLNAAAKSLVKIGFE